MVSEEIPCRDDTSRCHRVTPVGNRRWGKRVDGSMISPWLEKFEKVSHLMVRCSGRCHMLGSRCFSNGRFAANASRRLLTLAFKSLDVTNDPANIRRQRSRRDREEEIPGLCNPRARGPGYRHGVSYQRSVG